MNAADRIRATVAQHKAEEQKAAEAARIKRDTEIAEAKAAGIAFAARQLPAMIEKIAQDVLASDYRRTGKVHLSLWTHYSGDEWPPRPSYVGDYEYRDELVRLLREEGFQVDSMTAASGITEREGEIGCWLEVRI